MSDEGTLDLERRLREAQTALSGARLAMDIQCERLAEQMQATHDARMVRKLTPDQFFATWVLGFYVALLGCAAFAAHSLGKSLWHLPAIGSAFLLSYSIGMLIWLSRRCKR